MRRLQTNPRFKGYILVINVLEVKNLRSGYQDLEIIHGLNFNVKKGETFLLLSLNGAGKTTLLRTIAGQIKPFSGKVLLEDEDVTNMPPYMRARKGMIFLGEQSIIPTISVMENLIVATYQAGIRESKSSISRALDMFPDLKPYVHKKAAALSGGQRKFLAFSMLIAAGSRMMLLDEPSLGLSPAYVKRIIEAVEKVKESGTTILLAEQNPSFAKLADTLVLLELGEIKFIGNPEEASRNDSIVKSFFQL